MERTNVTFVEKYLLIWFLVLIVLLTWLCFYGPAFGEVNAQPEISSTRETIYIARARVDILANGVIVVDYYSNGHFGSIRAISGTITLERLRPGESPRIEIIHYSDGAIFYEVFIEAKTEV